jgi:photosystem II stability/assembly factor-like uncharacterized protein
MKLWVVFAVLWLTIPRAEPLRFEVTSALPSASGRLFVVISRSDRPEPRTTISDAAMNAPPILARDVRNLGPGAVTVLDKTSEIFPIASLDVLPAGDYYVQALFSTNTELKSSVNAPGDRYSSVQRIHLDPRVGGVVKLQLTETIPAEQLPPDDQYLKYVKFQSNLLTRFHGRPIYLRAGIILPRNYVTDGTTFFPVRIHIGGYGTRFTSVQRLMAPNSEFRRMWLSDDTPRFIYLQLDGDGPLGDPYQINSDNSGPYGDAITRELIPYLEKEFRVIRQPYARVLDGESTGGWVSLALKIFYPDFFNAVWSSCPDGVDFRGFQLIDIYNDKNAYVDDRGADRPSKRDINGNVEFTIRHECQMENVMGSAGSWTMSGQQWGAWNAAYGPRGADGRPIPLWDPKTGLINKSVVDHWKKYDLRMVLEQNWKTLGPKLRGKIHISVGEADSYYLNNAVHLLDAFFRTATPPADARIVYGAGRGHCWNSLSEAQMMNEMAAAVGQGTRGQTPRLSTPIGAGSWTAQESGTTARLRGVSVVDAQVVWASGSNGTFDRTTDGGNHWQPSTVPGATDLDFRDIHAVDANTAYLLSAGEGQKSRIYKTRNGGKMWTIQFMNSEPAAFFDGFAFWDANHGIAFSDPVHGHFPIILTDNGGTTWTPIPSANLPVAVPGEAAFAASGTSITVFGKKDVWFATGGSIARVFHSSDAGLTWSVSNTPIVSGSQSAGIFSIFFLDPQRGFIVGGDYQRERESNANFAESHDGGRSWALGAPLPGYRSVITSVSALPDLIAAGPSGVDYMMALLGKWVDQPLDGIDAISVFPGKMRNPIVWAVGQNGRIYRGRVPATLRL